MNQPDEVAATEANVVARAHAPQPAPMPDVPTVSLAVVSVRGVGLSVLAVVAIVYTLAWAKDFLIPVTFAIFIAYTLNPLVVWMERIRIPRLAGTCVLLLFLALLIGQAGYSLRGEFQSIAERLPTAAQKFARAIAKAQGGKSSTMQKIQAAATELETAAGQAAGAQSSRRIERVVVAPSSFNLSDWVWSGSKGALGAIGQVIIVTFLVFFLLLSGDTFKRKLVRLMGPSMANKKATIHVLSDINSSVQSYMFMLLVTNSLLALLMWGALHWIGVENAGAWAVASGLLHIIPYFGPLITAVAIGVVAFMQFDSFPMMLAVAATTLGIATLIGTFMTTWMTGKITRMNASAVFIVLLFWGWLWGIWGLLLGIPIIVVVKVVSERIDGMQLVSELLSE
jgi:predicted PurR-regulated permease PerM